MPTRRGAKEPVVFSAFGELANRIVARLRSQASRFRMQGERHSWSALAFMVAGAGFESATFGLCTRTQLSLALPGVGMLVFKFPNEF